MLNRSETSSIHSEVSVESFVELDEKALTKINYIVNELIMTEKTYMQDLQDIVMVRKSLQLIFLFVNSLVDIRLSFQSSRCSLYSELLTKFINLQGYMAPMEQCCDLFEPSIVKDIFINIKPIGDFHL